MTQDELGRICKSIVDNYRGHSGATTITTNGPETDLELVVAVLALLAEHQEMQQQLQAKENRLEGMQAELYRQVDYKDSFYGQLQALREAALSLYNEVLSGAGIYSPELGDTIGDRYALDLEVLRQALEQPDAD